MVDTRVQFCYFHWVWEMSKKKTSDSLSSGERSPNHKNVDLNLEAPGEFISIQAVTANQYDVSYIT